MPPNPFASIYVAEEVDPRTFVELFSPLLVHDTISLFEPGNVILMGTQGSGKSMLLNLLKPEARIAYAQHNVAFPLDGIVPPFVGAGVNLTRCGAIDFGQRMLPGQDVEGGSVVEAYFGDFLNYWIVRDLCRAVRLLASGPPQLAIRPRAEQLHGFAREVARDPCWVGHLDGVTTFEALEERLTNRIQVYRAFLNYNSEALPQSVVGTKTSVGEPIAVAAEVLRSAAVIDEDNQVFIRVDQYEELGRLEERAKQDMPDQRQHFGGFASVIHKMVGLRDPRISYRIGTRRHAWPDEARMQGTAAVLEELRNYKLVDLDGVLRRGEHHPGLFRPFAEDVFVRRLRVSGYETPGDGARAMRSIFGPPLHTDELARRYASTLGAPIVQAEPSWAEGITKRLLALAEQDPLNAVLAEAWLRQQSAQKKPTGKLDSIDWENPPWVTREWWRKERMNLALLQLAARKRQRMIWAGDKVIRDLAGFNILAFMSLCQGVFNAWLRPLRIAGTERPPYQLPDLSQEDVLYLQDQGIREASEYWYRKVQSDPDGDTRQRFVDVLGRQFRDWLRNDRQMSYPGHNGFSVEIDDLAAHGEVDSALRAAAAFGVLFDTTHTTRNKGGARRRKWYLNPVYSPYFQLPIAHQKEPRYVRADEVAGWLRQALSGGEPPAAVERQSLQMQLDLASS